MMPENKPLRAVPRPMPQVELIQLTQEELRGLSESMPAAHLSGAPDGALPPPHVARRALAQVEAGVSAFWCVPFLIIAKHEGAVLGGCTFKGPPLNDAVEIAYGVAGKARGKGIATAAVGQLLQLVATDCAVRQVVAEILPANIGSSKVVSRLGFMERESYVDTDGETVVRWTYSVR